MAKKLNSSKKIFIVLICVCLLTPLIASAKFWGREIEEFGVVQDPSGNCFFRTSETTYVFWIKTGNEIVDTPIAYP